MTQKIIINAWVQVSLPFGGMEFACWKFFLPWVLSWFLVWGSLAALPAFVAAENATGGSGVSVIKRSFFVIHPSGMFPSS
jgi:hypothetical protein